MITDLVEETELPSGGNKAHCKAVHARYNSVLDWYLNLRKREDMSVRGAFEEGIHAAALSLTYTHTIALVLGVDEAWHLRADTGTFANVGTVVGILVEVAVYILDAAVLDAVPSATDDTGMWDAARGMLDVVVDTVRVGVTADGTVRKVHGIALGSRGYLVMLVHLLN